jgi:tetratricopeptide (TPR) repeat protein
MGRRVKLKAAGPAAEALRDCRQLLRHLAHPRRLHENPLANSIWAASGLEPDRSSEVDLARCLEASVRLTLGRASLRQRVIVERCDLAGEANAQVAADLRISLRHLFRERKAAIVIMTTHFTEEGSRGLVTAQVGPDAVALQLSLAARLEQNGQWVVAAEMLERLSTELDDAPRRCLVESRLTDLYTDVGRYSLADKHMRRALNLCRRNVGPAWLSAEAAVSAARLALATGDVVTARNAARQSCLELRSWTPSSSDPRLGSALLDALNLASLIAIARGDAGATAALASEALGVARQLQSPKPGALIEARLYAVEADILAGDTTRAESDLWACYQLAIAGGQTRDALGIAVFLAGYLRWMERPHQSIELLKPLAQAARQVGTGDVLGGLFIELGKAASDVRATGLVRKCLAELDTFSHVSPWIRANADLLRAQTEFSNERFDLSLAASESAESSLIRIGRERLVGSALQLQAESLRALGDIERAVRTMRLAIERFQSTGQNYRRLIAAYLTMGSLTGDAKFNVKARRLRARLSATGTV